MPVTKSRRKFLFYYGLQGVPLCIATNAVALPLTISNLVKGFGGVGPVVEERVVVSAPRLAETGDIVPLRIKVQSPMTELDFVKQIHVFAPKNEYKHVVSFSLSPYNQRAELYTKIRLSTSQKIVAIARMNDESLWSGSTEVEVTRSDCG